MRHLVKVPTSIEAIHAALAKELPQYEVELKQNPIFNHQYVEVRKSSTAGAWITLRKEKITVQGVVPSASARIFLGGLLLLLITWSGRKEVSGTASEVIARNF